MDHLQGTLSLTSNLVKYHPLFLYPYVLYYLLDLFAQQVLLLGSRAQQSAQYCFTTTCRTGYMATSHWLSCLSLVSQQAHEVARFASVSQVLR